MPFKRGDLVVYNRHGKIGVAECNGNVGVVLGKADTCAGIQHYRVSWVSAVNDSRSVAFPAEVLLKRLGHIDLPEVDCAV